MESKRGVLMTHLQAKTRSFGDPSTNYAYSPLAKWDDPPGIQYLWEETELYQRQQVFETPSSYTAYKIFQQV